MRANRGRDTGPELAVRRIVHASGFRYRVNCRPEPDLRRTVDMMFTRARVVVMIDGCFWHGCPAHHQSPRANADFWNAKIARNRERDAETTTALSERGWLVLRYWEHEVRADATAVAARVMRAVRARSGRTLAQERIERLPEEATHFRPTDDEGPVQ